MDKSQPEQDAASDRSPAWLPLVGMLGGFVLLFLAFRRRRKER